MRVGDFGVEVVAHGEGRVRELESGHVLARPGQVYRIRLRNHGPLRCVTDVCVDGQPVTAGGLVLDPWSATELERPIGTTDDGRFTVVAEGDESVFGPDGGRDDPALGLIAARFRRELPRQDRPTDEPPLRPFPSLVPTLPAPPGPAPGAPPTPGTPGRPGVPPLPPRWPPVPPEWVPPQNRVEPGSPAAPDAMILASAAQAGAAARPLPGRMGDAVAPEGIERAAGTGLTGHSEQRFVPVSLGELETEATVIQLRLVIGTEAALAAETPRPLVERPAAPARPAPRP
ncbi:MAG TPA: hypothetical protein VFS08_12905 [Gemmatimonadaceae bacterium]|nr:hypothetical protein [Gemmatimonadaceae bacterium]